jgi:hypothetical protein
MFAIMREQSSALRMREHQHVLIRNTQTGLACLSNRQHVVAQSPQGFHGRDGEVLISVEAGQRLRLVVLANLMFNLFDVTGDK